jgi:hypothetical protein
MFGLVNRFDHLQAVITNTYYIMADFHTTNHSTLNLLSLLSLLFIAALNNGYSSAVFLLSSSWQWILHSNCNSHALGMTVLQHTYELSLQITRQVFPSQADFQVWTDLHSTIPMSQLNSFAPNLISWQAGASI